MTGTNRKIGMGSNEEGSLIKAAAGRLAWINVWQYHDGEGTTVFVLESGPGRTLSKWHFDRFIETISEVLGPGRAFFVEGIEDVAPDTWTKMTLL